MFICVTHVDSKTSIPCFTQPMASGPTFPKVKGLQLKWWDETNWPITDPQGFPKFYGTCDDDADVSIAGVISTPSEEVYNQLYQEELARRALIPETFSTTVSPRQARLALLKANVLSQVNQAIENLQEPLRSAAKIEWEYATEIKITSPIIVVVKEALGWDTQKIQDLFLSANKISTDDFLNNT